MKHSTPDSLSICPVLSAIFLNGLLIKRNLIIQILHVLLPFPLLRCHVLPVSLQHLHAFRHCAPTLVAQFGIPPDIRKLHTGLFKTLYESNPLNVTLRIIASAALIARHPDQSFFLIIAQRTFRQINSFKKVLDLNHSSSHKLLLYLRSITHYGGIIK